MLISQAFHKTEYHFLLHYTAQCRTSDSLGDDFPKLWISLGREFFKLLSVNQMCHLLNGDEENYEWCLRGTEISQRDELPKLVQSPNQSVSTFLFLVFIDI